MTWVIVAVVVVVIAVVAFLAWRRERTRRLRERFGPEHERAGEERGDPRAAEIRPLDPEARAEYALRWSSIQRRFVDSPGSAVGAADALVLDVMHERGYPVDHPDVAENYRAASAISVRAGHNEASTEDLRQAMVHYRALFENLLEARVPVHATHGEEPA